MRVWLLLALGVWGFATVAHAATPPVAARHSVVDRYFDTPVADDYRWLEDSAQDSVRAWSDGQNAVSRAWLDSLPDRPAVLRRVTQLADMAEASYRGLRYAGGAYFATKDQPPRQQALLVRLPSLDDLSQQNTVLDPVALDSTGRTTIDFFVPSLDGKRVAVSLSRSGSEAGSVRVFDAATGAMLPDVVPGVNGGTAGGSVAWNADGTGFYRTRYPQRGERPDADLPFYLQVYYHALGTDASADRYVVGKEFPKIAEIDLRSASDGALTLVDVSNGDGGAHMFWVIEDGVPRPLTSFADTVVSAAIGDDALYLLSRHDAPNGAVLRVPRPRPDFAAAKVVIPETPLAILGVTPTPGRLVVRYIDGGPSRLRSFTHAGALLGEIPLPEISAASQPLSIGGEQVLVQIESYTQPARWVRWDAGQERMSPTAIEVRSAVSFADVEVKRVFARSKDGTRVPMNILMTRGTPLDGTAPLLLYGYGGYGINQLPGFTPTTKTWLEQGGIYVVANIRGGGEYGDAWHLAGNLTRKQNVFDDFAACAQTLIDEHYTSANHLAIRGGSNGGLLMGAMLTQHPTLFRACVSSVGVYDMLRAELEPNGEFNITEFGTVKDRAQFEAMFAASPYHHVKDGVKYPSVLMTTGANDPRVSPWHSRKMVARLQAANVSTHPILLRTSASTGHGRGTPRSERNLLSADVYAFLFHELGVKYRDVAVAP